MGPRGAGGYNRRAVLNLASRTDSGWVEIALSDLDELLLDHGSYLELAVQASDESSARARLLELAEREAEIIADPSPMVRMHA
jgi:tRNA isopentenyl-2-thiomethyl-A-37 hydroxylase MiaE